MEYTYLVTYLEVVYVTVISLIHSVSNYSSDVIKLYLFEYTFVFKLKQVLNYFKGSLTGNDSVIQ